MSNITVAEILKIHGDWIEGKQFASLVHEKLKLSERMAYIKIKKAVENKEILKAALPDRTVLYGLVEFGPPKFEKEKEKRSLSVDFYNSLVFQFWKEREQAQQERLHGNIFHAWRITKSFAALLPNSPKKHELMMFIAKTDARRDYTQSDTINKYYNAIPQAWEKIASILSEP